MDRNFEFPRRVWFLVKADPISQLLLGGYLPLLLLSILRPIFFLALAAWILFWGILTVSAKRGRPAWLSTLLTPNFYSVRSPFGWRGIFQRRAESLPCRDLILSLCKEQVALPAALTPGQYRAVTHETVIRRLEHMEKVCFVQKKYAYTASMASIYNAMTHNKCRHCPHPCRFYLAAQKPRPFFYLVFTVLP